jgi:hypothetical protein
MSSRLLWVGAVAAAAVAVVGALAILRADGDGGPSACSLADATGCTRAAGRTLTITDPTDGNGTGPEYVTCDTSLLSLSHPDAEVTGEGWPVKVRITFPEGRVLENHATGFSISPGCEGDGDPDTIDLVLEIDGDGLTRGFAADAMKVKSTVDPSGGIQLTGRLNCGPSPEGVHQDGIQLQGGNGIGFYDVEVGDWDEGVATCQGAGGGFFISRTPMSVGTDITVERLRSVTCNHGLGINRDSKSSGRMVDSAFRAKNPADARAGKCEFQVGACADFDRAPDWEFVDVVCDDWPYDRTPVR